MANIRIKGEGWKKHGGKNYVGGASNDLGWEVQSDGTISFHVSQYDRGRYSKDWQKKLGQRYLIECIKEQVAESGIWNFETDFEEVNGEIQVEVKSMW